MSIITTRPNLAISQPLPASLNGTVGSTKQFSIIFCLLLLSMASGYSAKAQTITFETPSYTLGNISGQDGWTKFGPYDHAVSSSVGTAGFGAQSLRISNAITNGSFNDMSFSKPVVNEAGETSAANGGWSGGTRQNYFESEFSIGSAVPGAQQPGLLMSVSPNRGDTARMSYLRFEDLADGFHIFFDDYRDVAPFGNSLGDPLGCGGPGGGADSFTETDIATLDRSVPHTIKFGLFLWDGPRNDVVQIFIDGLLVKTGTSWEDYFRYCEGNPTRTVDSLMFRTSGTAVPANAGNGFLIDNMTTNTSIVGPSAAEVSISGRLITAMGRGISNGLVLLSDMNGRRQFAVSSSFGYYRFDKVVAGQTYIVSVISKRYIFPPREVTVSDELTNVDLTAEP